MLKKVVSRIVVVMALSGCDDEKAPHLPVISFSENGRIEIIEGSLPDIVSSYGPGIFLSEPAQTDVSVYLSTSGVAKVNEDYTFTNPVVIPQGSTFASVGLQFVTDKLDEFDEAGNFRLEHASIEANLDTATGKFLIVDDDGSDLRISLIWASGGNTGLDPIDMDLYLWRESTPGSNNFEVVKKSVNRAPSGYESTWVSGLDADGRYGVSYVYHSGNTENLSFRVIFESLGGSILEGGMPQLEFTPTYNVKNVNSGEVVIREQFFTKKGFQFKEITPVIVPEIGS